MEILRCGRLLEIPRPRRGLAPAGFRDIEKRAINLGDCPVGLRGILVRSKHLVSNKHTWVSGAIAEAQRKPLVVGTESSV